MSRPLPGCEDELRAYEKAKRIKKNEKYFSSARKSADRKMDKAKDAYKACQKARDDVAVLMLVRATLRSRKDLGIKTPMNWTKVPIEDLNKDEERAIAKHWKKSSLAQLVDPIMKENQKLGISQQVSYAVASMAADRIADRAATASKVVIWIIITAAVIAAVVFTGGAAAGAGAAAAGGAAATGGAVAAGGAAAATGTAVATTTVVATGTGITAAGAATTAGTAGATYVAGKATTDPVGTLDKIKAASDAGGDLMSRKLRKIADEAESEYKKVRRHNVDRMARAKAEAERISKRAISGPVAPSGASIDSALSSGSADWYKKPVVLAGAGVGAALLLVLALRR